MRDWLEARLLGTRGLSAVGWIVFAVGWLVAGAGRLLSASDGPMVVAWTLQGIGVVAVLVVVGTCVASGQ